MPRESHCAPLFLNCIAAFDWLIALEYGRVDDGQPNENWRGVTDRLGYLHDRPGGLCVGFKVIGFSDFDTERDEYWGLWRPPFFDVPLLALRSATAGEVILAAQAYFGDGSSLNRGFFERATSAAGGEALGLWNCCIASGDQMGHFGLGCALLEQGYSAQAYKHLRHYSEIAPAQPWNWCWYGQAAEAVGQIEEARQAYARAVELEEAGAEETDAFDRLCQLRDQVEGRRRSA
jgi:hypothetical protein